MDILKDLPTFGKLMLAPSETVQIPAKKFSLHPTLGINLTKILETFDNLWTHLVKSDSLADDPSHS